MRFTVPDFGMSRGVTSVHDVPPSRVTCTRPSSLPVHRMEAFDGSSASEKMVLNISTPVWSPLIGPPAMPCVDLSLVVRSGLITVHDMPPSRLRCTTCDAWNTVLRSWRDTRIGATHWKRYFSSDAFCPTCCCG